MKKNGFTLIELMVTVAVLAIIAAIAYPSYQEQMRKTYRSEAKAALMDAAAKAERHYTQFGNYGGTIPIPATTENGYYTINLVAGTSASPQTFLITAAPVSLGPQDVDKCGSFTIDQAQTKLVTGASLSPEQCW
jgi:type IV pilus assembly protein PilE